VSADGAGGDDEGLLAALSLYAVCQAAILPT
jgi:hypothetical protein